MMIAIFYGYVGRWFSKLHNIQSCNKHRSQNTDYLIHHQVSYNTDLRYTDYYSDSDQYYTYYQDMDSHSITPTQYGTTSTQT